MNAKRKELVGVALSIASAKDLRELPLERLDSLRSIIGNAV